MEAACGIEFVEGETDARTDKMAVCRHRKRELWEIKMAELRDEIRQDKSRQSWEVVRGHGRLWEVCSLRVIAGRGQNVDHLCSSWQVQVQNSKRRGGNVAL